MPLSSFPGRHPIRVVSLVGGTAAILSVQKAAALAIAQSGVAAFFIAGVTWTALGVSAGWFVLAVTLLAVLIRGDRYRELGALIAGGFVSRVTPRSAPAQDGLATAPRSSNACSSGRWSASLPGTTWPLLSSALSGAAVHGPRRTGRPCDTAGFSRDRTCCGSGPASAAISAATRSREPCGRAPEFCSSLSYGAC